MIYRVLWSPYAEKRLEAILRDRLSHFELAAAAREIDRQLMVQPLQFGESRYDSVRIGFIRPLGVQFDVRTVIVDDVWRIE